MIISYDSKYCLAITHEGDEQFQVQSFSLATIFKEEPNSSGGKGRDEPHFKKEYKGRYLKMNLIEQNDAGNVFCIGFVDNGEFFISVLAPDGAELAKLELNQVLGIDNKSSAIVGFYEPLITACFLPNDDLFVQVYHRIDQISHHFVFNHNTGYQPATRDLGEKQASAMDNSGGIRGLRSKMTGEAAAAMKEVNLKAKKQAGEIQALKFKEAQFEKAREQMEKKIQQLELSLH